jgi:hypothetical protein
MNELMTQKAFVIDGEDDDYFSQFSSHNYAWQISDRNDAFIGLGRLSGVGLLSRIERSRRTGGDPVLLKGTTEGEFTFTFGPREDPYTLKGVGGPILELNADTPLLTGADGEAILFSHFRMAISFPETLERNLKRYFERTFVKLTEAKLYPSSGRLDFH